MNAKNKKPLRVRQRSASSFKVVISYIAPDKGVRKYRARVHEVGAHRAADLAVEFLLEECPGAQVLARAAKRVVRTSVRRAQAQPDGLGRALACC